MPVTDKDVRKYVANAAQYYMADDINEAGDYEDEEFEELQSRAKELIREIRNS